LIVFDIWARASGIQECWPFTFTNGLLSMLDFIDDLSFLGVREIHQTNKNKNIKDSRKFVPIEMVMNRHWVKKNCILWVVPSTLNDICLARERIFFSIVEDMFFWNKVVDNAGISLCDIIISSAM
jgi:hypothetical protein